MKTDSSNASKLRMKRLKPTTLNRMARTNEADIMKRLLYFLPTILVLGFLAFILRFLGDPSADLIDYLICGGILFVFALSDFLLSKKLWFGGIPGALLGSYVIYYGSQYHGQVLDERPIGAVILAYYVILGILTAYRQKRADK